MFTVSILRATDKDVIMYHLHSMFASLRIYERTMLKIHSWPNRHPLLKSEVHIFCNYDKSLQIDTGSQDIIFERRTFPLGMLCTTRTSPRLVHEKKHRCNNVFID
jgi:hypothetical protein